MYVEAEDNWNQTMVLSKKIEVAMVEKIGSKIDQFLRFYV
jgi:hypothetical protein